jgi:hypothetical protein
MMKRILIPFIIFFASVNCVLSQTVDSISVEQSGDFVKIGYHILNSNPNQVYRVKVLFSINGLNTEIRSATGDMGDHVVGGKSEYWVVWDVLKDVDELGAAEFVVRAELLADNTPEEIKKRKGLLNMQGVLQVPGPGIGVRVGIMGKAGVSFQYILAMGVIDYESGFSGSEPRLSRFSTDFTLRVSNKNDFQTHLLAGITVGQQVIMENMPQWGTNYMTHFGPGIEAGMIFIKKKAVFSITASKLLTSLTEEGEAISKTGYLTAGFGVKF